MNGNKLQPRVQIYSHILKCDTLGKQVMYLSMKKLLPINQLSLYWIQVDTPQGTCIILATSKGICYVSTPGSTLEKATQWAKNKCNTEVLLDGSDMPILQRAAQELLQYCSGTLQSFSGPFDLYGTDFQKKVWRQLGRIPFGTTMTYGQIATLTGNPKAARAVGLANNKNPIAIMIPCHRVVGSNGKLVGYAGGLETKEWLLKLEQRI